MNIFYYLYGYKGIHIEAELEVSIMDMLPI